MVEQPDDGNGPARVVIVGGGLAGLELARHLDVAGVDGVVVVEAGPDGDRRHVNAVHDPGAALDMWLDSDTAADLWRPWESATPPFYTRHGGLRRRLGGRSLYWHGVILPIEPWALASPPWPATVVTDLTESWNGGPGLYERVSDDLARWRSEVPAPPPPPPLTVAGWRLQPTPKALRPAGRAGWEAYSPLSYWTTPGRAPSTRFRTDARVLGVLVDDGRAVGVRVVDGAGHTGDVRCDTVVLAAGTIENSRLAIQARHDVGVSSGSELSGLADHIEQGIMVVLDVDRLPPAIAELALADSSHQMPVAGSRTRLFTRFYPLTGSDGKRVVLEAFATGEQVSDSYASVRCRVDARWPWPTTVHAGLSPADRDVVEEGRRILTAFWQDLAALVGLPPGDVSFPSFDDPDRTVADVLLGLGGDVEVGTPTGWCSLLGTVDHEGGTLPVGGLLDERQEFRDIRGLYAVGPSTFARSGAANPSLTTLALSRRLAGLLAKALP
ncbi:GMC family oxidoreductase [Micromonospora schwarzwaldensis]|uniref:GMC oxidoreductase n=1 Tax=Micromonospora sp. DSM 45708 TaxID=3111767 RepID=UPI0031D2B2FC